MNQTVRTLAVFALAAVGATQTLLASEGTITGWVKPSDAWQDQVFVKNADGKDVARIRIFFARGQIDVQLANGKWSDQWRCLGRLKQMRDQWMHVAYVWKDDGNSWFYVNGKPYDPTTLFGDKQTSVKGDRLGEAVSFKFNPEKARDFKLGKRARSAAEVLAEYYAVCPVDLVMDDSFIRAGESASATWILAPFGALTRPVISKDFHPAPATVEIATRIQRVGKDGSVEDAVLAETPFARHEVTKPIVFKTAPRAWPAGLYRLAVTIRRPDAKTETARAIFFRAIDPIKLDFANASDKPWKKGKTLFSKTYATAKDIRWSSGDLHTAKDASGAYLEAGLDVGNRFADIIPIDKDAIGKPCLIEIEWPDDKARQMGLYMYEIVPNSCRDHLQGGLVTGDEIPNTFARQVRRYLYVPTGTNALFEARTFVKGRPAAVAKFTISTLAEPLPVLKIRKPACGRGRRFGHCDEDQTFDNNISSAIMGAPPDESLRNLIAYFGYTGQNAFSYSVIRYNADYGALDGSVTIPSNWPREQGAWKGVIRALKANGIDYLAQSTMGNVPAFANHQYLDDDIEARGLILRNPDGSFVQGIAKRYCRPDLTKSETHQMIADGVRPMLAYALNNGAESASVELKGDIFNNWGFPSATIGPQNLETRTAITTAAFKKTLDALKKAAPNGTLRVVTTPTEENRRKHGIDVDKIAALGGIEFAHMRGNTDYYFARFNGQTRGALESLDRLYDPEAPELKKLAALSKGGSLPLTMVYPQYFETFVRPLGDDKRFGNYFQNADIKPHGRWYLKEPAYCLAKADTLRFVIGAQPLGSLGNEDETREFTAAYCALPEQPFTTIPGVDDPIVARYFVAPEGTYVYVVNYCHLPVEARLNTAVKAEDLSKGTVVSLATVALKPFELRSFLVAPAARLNAKTLVLARGAYDQTAFDARQTQLKAIFEKLRSGGLDFSAGEQSLAKAREALGQGRLAAAHYWFYHRTVQAAVEAFAQYDDLVAENAMHAAGRWAVNGGCNYFTRIGNRLFSPDRQWDGATYGYYGEAPRAVAREKEFCDAASPELELFTTERFDIAGYKFKLPKGRYHVKIYAKWAYPHSFKEAGRLVASYALNGRKFADVDWFKDANGDIKKTFVFEGDADVTDVLDISIDSKTTVSACLVNGIEIQRTTSKVNLWPDGKMPSAQTHQHTPYLVWHTPKELKTRAVLIAVSGGGYSGNGIEGFEVSPMRDYMLEKGMTVVTMLYRTPRPKGLAKHVTAWQDAQRTVRLVRKMAKERGLDPELIGFTGCSAGGHLAVMTAVSSQTPAYDPVDAIDAIPCHLNWAIPVYPAYLLADGTDRHNTKKGNDLADGFAPELAFDAATPPLCFFHGDSDGWSAMGSIRAYHKLRTMGIPAEVHALALENHCFQSNPRPGTPAAIWKDIAWAWLVSMDIVTGHPATWQKGWQNLATGVFGPKLSEVADFEPKTWHACDWGNVILTAEKDTPLWFKGDWSDFVLDLEYKLDPGANSGVILYASDVKNWIPNSVEVQLLDDAAPKWRKDPPRLKNGGLYGHVGPAKSNVKPAGEWNRMTIWAQGRHIRVVVNGETTVDDDLSRYTSAKTNPDGTPIQPWLSRPLADLPTHGAIGLQGKHGGARPYFRNVRIRRLNP